MKYLVLIIAVITTVSLVGCEVSEPGLKVSYDVVAIDSVTMPSSFSFGQTYQIPVYYDRPTSCHVFDGFDVQADLNTREVTTVLAKLDSGDCIDQDVPEEQILNFTVASNGSYVFKFFNGIDASGEATYLEYNIIVVE